MASPADSTVRSPNRSTSEPPPKAETKRKNAKALTASPTAVVPTPKDRAYSGMAGATMPKPRATTKATTARMPTSRGSSVRPRHSTSRMLARRRPAEGRHEGEEPEGPDGHPDRAPPHPEGPGVQRDGRCQDAEAEGDHKGGDGEDAAPPGHPRPPPPQHVPDARTAAAGARRGP